MQRLSGSCTPGRSNRTGGVGCAVRTGTIAKPNVGFRGQIVYVAMRDIRAGEELFHYYAMERSDEYSLDCHCGSPLCRGKITGQDWKLTELQERYGDYFSIYIRNKFGTSSR